MTVINLPPEKAKYRSIKLTETIRSEILSNVMKVFDARNQKVDTTAEATALWDRWMEYNYPVSYRAACDEFTLNGSTFIQTGYGISTLLWPKSGAYHHLKIEERPMPEKTVIKLQAELVDWPEAKALHDKLKLSDTRQANRNKTSSQTKTLLASVNTTKQLLETWPEVAKYVTPYITGLREANLPAVSVTAVNNILGWDTTE